MKNISDNDLNMNRTDSTDGFEDLYDKIAFDSKNTSGNIKSKGHDDGDTS